MLTRTCGRGLEARAAPGSDLSGVVGAFAGGTGTGGAGATLVWLLNVKNGAFVR
jgi:hypothetical protein